MGAQSQGFDYRASLKLGFPPSGNLDAWAGYGFRLWGEVEPGNPEKFLYGYVRPNFRLQSAILVNRAEARLDVYPLSFLGATVGQVLSHRMVSKIGKHDDSTGFDCQNVACDGVLMRSFAEAKLKFGYARFFGVLFYRRDLLVADTAQHRRFLDTSTSLTGSGGVDTLETYWITAGVKLSDRWSVGGKSEYNRMRSSGESSTEQQIFGVYSWAPRWSVAPGFKVRDRPRQKAAVGVGVQLNWVGRESIEI